MVMWPKQRAAHSPHRGTMDSGPRPGRGGGAAHLQRGEDGVVDLRREVGAAEDHAAAGAPQRLVCRRRDDVGVLERRRHDARGDEARDVRHV